MASYLEFGNDMASRCGVDLNSAWHFLEQSALFALPLFQFGRLWIPKRASRR
jgi:hypothetical protein